MSEDEVRPPDEVTGKGRQNDPPPPPYDPDFELIGYLEEREGEVRPRKRG